MKASCLCSIAGTAFVSILFISATSCSSSVPADAPEKTAARKTENAAAPTTEPTAAQPAEQAAANTEIKAPAKAVTPATVAEAEKVLDLETFPLPAGTKMQSPRRMAALSYSVDGSLKDILDFNVQELTKRGWKEVAGTRREGPYTGADFTNGDFHLNLSVMQTAPNMPVSVTFARYGNVALTSLPVPAGAKQLYAFPATIMYTTEAPVEKTAAECRELMLKAGWTPYGSAGTTAYYRQNAVLVLANVMSAPGQGGKTAITYTSNLLSLDLPAFPEAIDFRYTDMTTEISFDTNSTPKEVTDFYRKELASAGWKATTDEPVAIDWKKLTIFRKPDQEMITVTTSDFEGRTRVRIDYQTAAEVAEEELRTYIEAGRKATYRKGEKPEIKLDTADSLAAQQEQPYTLRMQVKRGTANAVATAVVDALTAAGWSGKPPAEAPVFRTWMLQKGEAQIWVMATEPTKADSWVAVTGAGVTFKP